MGDIRVLIADDHALFREGLKAQSILITKLQTALTNRFTADDDIDGYDILSLLTLLV